MRAREPRRSVLIRARMRLDTGWSDVCIRNISSRGLMVNAATAVPRGTYVEVRRGRHIIVARVAWARDNCFGLHSREALPVDEIIREPDLSRIRRPDASAEPGSFERRAAPRTELATQLKVRNDEARRLARFMEFVATIFAAAVLTAFAGTAMIQAIARPMAQIEQAFGKQHLPTP